MFCWSTWQLAILRVYGILHQTHPNAYLVTKRACKLGI
jgi:hypothetical protein